MQNTGTFILALFLCGVIGYLLGSVNSSIVLARVMKKGDIREKGSGNAGMTNVLRTMGKLPALITFIGDFVKCIIAVLIACGLLKLFGVSGEGVAIGKYVAGVLCVIGHMFPIFFGFRGGKGIVTSAAMMSVTDWRIFIAILLTFIILFAIKRIVSLGSVVCAAVYPVYTFLITFFFEFCGSPLKDGEGSSLFYLIFATVCSVIVAAVVLYRHRSNIGRLMRGEEKPIF